MSKFDLVWQFEIRLHYRIRYGAGSGMEQDAAVCTDAKSGDDASASATTTTWGLS